ncbi:helix-turn-helix domain-containing protein [Nocardioides hankookensis]|uniref:Helix-turn-helix domain-containing protein n=1 Tax=Nocardioides hankookensis TaxID=443157 RepID=A0ABW1LQE2_9ACTN
MTTSPQEQGAALLSSIAGRRIRGLRAELGLSQNALAIRTGLGLSRAAMSERETGVKPVPVDELPIFASVLGVSVAYLMGFTDDRSRPLEEAASEVVVRHQGLEPRTR